MNVVLKSAERYLVSLTADERQIILHSLTVAREILPPTDIVVERERMIASVIENLSESAVEGLPMFETAVAWADTGSVMIRAITVFGDPVEMSTDEAAAFISTIEEARMRAS